ncbi:MAG: cation:proton antiporter [Ignavibacteriales bacterium]|nr:cation:proton antiporter [Ignavibacteriales bacterium]
MHSSILFAIGLSIVAASVLAYFAQFLRQPPLLGYIAAGMIIGPHGLGLIERQEDVTAISELGLAFLLFIVGLEIDVKKFVRSGTASSVIGVVQVALCSLLGYALALWLGYKQLDAVYIGVTLSFSSTMIVVKLLSDRGELDTLPGRVTLGILLVQDALAIFVLAGQSNINDPSFGPVVVSIILGLGLVLVSFLVSRYALPAAFQRVARNPEMVLVLSIAWCFVMCWLALEAGFSIAMGALIAGVSISTFPYSHDVIAKIRSLRDFFVTLFFVSLGMQILLSSVGMVISGFLLSAFIIGSRIASILPVSMFMRLGSRAGILSSLNLSQSSEFSLVIASLGLSYGHITPEIVSLIALTLVITSTASTYMIMSSHVLARLGVRLMEQIGIRSSHLQDEDVYETREGEIVILGCHRVGSGLVEAIRPEWPLVHVLDFNPEVLERLRARGIAASYIDISHFDALEEMGIHRASIVICTLPDDYLRGTSNEALLKYLKARKVRAKIIVYANSVKDALRLYEEGADHVILPHILTGEQIAALVLLRNDRGFRRIRTSTIKELKNRNEVLP